jgi:hypothetical protein
MHAFLAKAISCSHSSNPIGKTSCMKQKLGKHFKESYGMMSNYGLTIDSNCIVGIMTPF